MTFFNDSEDDDYSSSDEECQHYIIEDGRYCKACGLAMFAPILPDDINTEDNQGAKKVVSHNVLLLNSARCLNIETEAKNILLEEIEKSSLNVKCGKDSVNKLLFIYGYIYLIFSGKIECTPNRWIRVCNIPVKLSCAKLLENFISGKGKPKIFIPDVYIREFLHDLKNYHFTPVEYEQDETCKKLSNFCRYIIIRRKITQGWTEIDNLEIEGREGFDAFPILKHDIDHVKNSPDEIIEDLKKLNSDFLSDVEIEVSPKDVIFDLPQRIAATALYCSLQFDLENIGEADIKGKMSAADAGTAAEFAFTEKNVSDYFSLTTKTLTTLSTDYGLRRMKVRSRKSTAIGSNREKIPESPER